STVASRLCCLCLLTLLPSPRPTLFPYTTLFRSLGRRPARQHDDPGGQVFAQRRLRVGRAPAALEERLAGRVQVKHAAIGFQEGMHAHVRIRALDARPLAERLAKPVADRVLDAQSGELEALQRTLLRRDVDAQRAIDAEVPWPVDGAHRGIEVVLVAIAEFGHPPEDARSEP